MSNKSLQIASVAIFADAVVGAMETYIKSTEKRVKELKCELPSDLSKIEPEQADKLSELLLKDSCVISTKGWVPAIRALQAETNKIIFGGRE